MLLLAFLSPRSDNEVDQVLRGFLATKENFDPVGIATRSSKPAATIKVRCVVRYP